MQFTHVERADKTIGLKLDIGNIAIPELEGKDILLTFPFKTYSKKYKMIKTDGDAVAFGAINNFFDTISEEDSRVIIIYMATMNHLIREKLGGGNMENLIPLTKELGEMMVSLNNTITLFDKLVDFADKHIPINEMKNAGERPQDTPLYTYRYNDIVRLMGCVMLSKMMMPIFGVIMHYTKRFEVESRIKESHCLLVVAPLFNQECPEVVHKLKEYIKRIVKKEFKESASAVNIGLTSNSMASYLYTSIVVRNFNNIDLYRDNSNHITAIMVGAKRAIDTKVGNMKDNHVMVRQDMSSVQDDKKMSQLEVDSIVSYSTADIVGLSYAFVDKTITGFLKEYEIPREMYDTCYKYNLDQQVMYGDTNKLIIELMFSGVFGGTNGLRYMRAPVMNKLITTAQLVCKSLGFIEIMHGISVGRNIIHKEALSPMDQQILIGYTSRPNYKIYTNRLCESSLGKDTLKQLFDVRLRTIVDCITAESHIFNTTPIIWDAIGQSNENNGVVQFSENYIDELCSLFNYIWQ